MAEIINLREYKKGKKRTQKADSAARNRALSGRSKAEKVTESAERERRQTEHDGKKIEPPSDDSGSS